MGNDIETVSIETAHGHKIVFKAFITGFDLREIEKAMYRNLSVKMDGKNPELEGFSAESLAASEDKTFELVVLSIDGVNENILDTLLKLPAPDFVQVRNKVNEITGKKALSPS